DRLPPPAAGDCRAAPLGPCGQGCQTRGGRAGAQSAVALVGAAQRRAHRCAVKASQDRWPRRADGAGCGMMRSLNILLIVTSLIMLAGVYALKFSIEGTAQERTALIAKIDEQEGELSLLKA